MKYETIYNEVSTQDFIFTLLITIIIFFFFMFFTTKIDVYFPRDFNTILTTSSLSILIGYQIIWIRYIFPKVLTFNKFGLIINEEFSSYLKDKFQLSWLWYSIVVVIVPLIILELFRFWRWRFFDGPMPPYFYIYEPHNPWALMLDVFNHLAGYLMLLLLAIIVWILINLIVIINEIDIKSLISVDIFHVDGMGGLKSLHNFILVMLSNYFIIIALAIMSYIPPYAKFSYETIFLMSLLSLGVILFTITSKTIKNLIKKDSISELNKIHMKYKKTHNKLVNDITELAKEELERLEFILDILEKREDRIRYVSRKRYDLRIITTFIGSFLIPIITLIEKISGFSF